MFKKVALFSAIILAAATAQAASVTNSGNQPVEITVSEGNKQSTLKIDANATVALPESATSIQLGKAQQQVNPASNFTIQNGRLTASAAQGSASEGNSQPSSQPSTQGQPQNRM